MALNHLQRTVAKTCPCHFLFIVFCVIGCGPTQGQNSFGWQAASNSTSPEHAWRRALECNIDTLDEDSWREVFMQKYYHRKPVILQGWNTASIKTLQLKTDREGLLEHFGNLDVRLSSFHELSTQGHGDTVVTLHEYLNNRWGDQYLFEGESFCKDGGLARRIGIRDNWIPAPGLDATGLFQEEVILAMGANGQGIPFHWHQDSYSVLLHGEKRWAIYAPGKMTPTGFWSQESFVTWLMTRWGGSDFVPPQWECMQRPGDLLYVPEGFFHATACIGDAIGLTHLASRPTNSTAFGLFSEAEQAPTHKTLELADRALKLDPTNAFLLMLKSNVYGSLGNLKKAVSLCRQALKQNPLSIDAHHTLLFGLEHMGDADGVRQHQAEMVRLGMDIKRSVEGDEIEVDLGNIPTGRAAEL